MRFGVAVFETGGQRWPYIAHLSLLSTPGGGINGPTNEKKK